MRAKAVETSTLDRMGIGFWKADLEARKFFVSDHWARLHNLPTDRECFDFEEQKNLVEDADWNAAEESLLRLMRNETSVYHAEIRVKLGPDEFVWIADRGIVTEYDETGKPKTIVGISYEISRKKPPRAREKLSADYLTYAELYDRAKQLGLEGRSKMTRAELSDWVARSSGRTKS